MTEPAPTTSASTDPRLSAHTTLRLGGPAARVVRAGTPTEVVDAVGAADRAGERVLLVGGGSNLVVADTGFDGTAVLLAGRGIGYERDGDRVLLTADAGEDWDELVAATVAEGFGGLECLSGIPGRTGATPVQNVGAYGVETADLLVDVDLYDRRTGTVREHVPAAVLGLAYRTSVLKGNDDAVVLRVRFALHADGRSAPVRYAELARTLGVEPETRTDPAAVREAVLGLRRGKGMVLDAADHDTWSAGSFFTNPILPAHEAPQVPGLTAWPAGEGRVKLSAAGLIQHAGFGRGHAGPGGRVSLSTRHVLALTHRGGGTTADLLALAREVQGGVAERFGVTLHPEPVLVDCAV